MSNDTRKLAAIMFTDIVGYSRIMSIDEKHGMDLLDTHDAILTPIIEKKTVILLEILHVKEVETPAQAAFEQVLGIVIEKYAAVVLHKIPEQEVKVAEDLIFDRRADGYDPLHAYLALFEGRKAEASEKRAPKRHPSKP